MRVLDIPGKLIKLTRMTLISTRGKVAVEGKVS